MQAGQRKMPLLEKANWFGAAGAGDDAIFRGAAAWAAREILARVMLNLPGTEGQRSAERAKESHGDGRGVGSSALAPLGGGGGETLSAGAAGGGGTTGPPAFLRELAAKLNAEFWLDRNMSHLSPILIF